MELVDQRAQGAGRPAWGGLAGWMMDALGDSLHALWKGARSRPVAQMHLLETLSLGGRRQIMLLACGEERYLVGCGPDSVSTIVRVGDSSIQPPAAL